MNILKIYETYHVPPNLQEHMLRVAYVGREIASGWRTNGEVDSARVAKTLLVHDMANILKYDFKTSSHLMGNEQKNIGYCSRVQEECRMKYGSNEHFATMAIVREIGLDTRSLSILENMPAVNDSNRIPSGDWELKICFYADFRVAPFSVTDYRARMDDLIERERRRGSPERELKRLAGIKTYLADLERELSGKTTVLLAGLDESGFTAARGDIVRSYRFP